jgi:hypothetical protein
MAQARAVEDSLTGGCLCGDVRYSVNGVLHAPDACHCTQCRKQSGHFWASTDVERASLSIRENGSLRWFQSSERVRRGFCGNCGSFLFWEASGTSRIAVSMGSFDGPTQLRLGSHIFARDKGDYYDISDGLPKFGNSPEDRID